MTTDKHAEAGSTVPDDPEQLKQEIERTREQLGETVEALVAKTDVKARAKERAGQLSQVVKDKTAQAKDQTTAAVGQARGQLAGKTPDAKTVTQPVQRAAQHVKQRAASPAGGLVAAAVAGVAVLGFIVIRRRRRR
jgi:prophage DNA circulation protein